MNERVIQQQLSFKGTDNEALELDKLLLRIFENPALQSYLMGVGNNGGKTELDFMDLPHQAVDLVKRVIGPTQVDVLRYDVNGRRHVGFRFDLKSLSSDEPNQDQK